MKQSLSELPSFYQILRSRSSLGRELGHRARYCFLLRKFCCITSSRSSPPVQVKVSKNIPTVDESCSVPRIICFFKCLSDHFYCKVSLVIGVITVDVSYRSDKLCCIFLLYHSALCQRLSVILRQF